MTESTEAEGVSSRDGARPLGFDRGQFTVPDDFDRPLPAQVLDAFYGDHEPHSASQRSNASTP